MKNKVKKVAKIVYYRFRIIESESFGLEKASKIISPTVNLALPKPVQNHVPKCHIHTFKYLQGW